MLVVEGLTVRYGPIVAVRAASIRIAAGEMVALIGPNGAGKTSLIGGVMGLVGATGRVAFDGRDVARLSTEDRVRLGMTVTPEGRRVFAGLTVGENLRLGAAIRADRRGVADDTERYLTMFPVLKERLGQLAGTLSGGEQQMLAIARSLMSRPRLLILDEPSLGLAPRIVARIFAHVAELKATGLTLLVVEQNIMQALAVADRAYMIASGEIRHEGPAAALRADPHLVDMYIGG